MRIPHHIAIIMDGNGRWAQGRGWPRVYGHIRGSRRVSPIVREVARLGVKALTLFAFSTENWLRPVNELGVLWKLLKKYLQNEAEDLKHRNIRLRIIGELDRLSTDVREVIHGTEKYLSGNNGLQLTLAISYGSRIELARAARLFAEDCLKGLHHPGEMNEHLMANYLWTSDSKELSQVDLMIRTSGEIRVSNFLLWQSAYAELVFMNLFWPDFEPQHLISAIQEYSFRKRRFGALDVDLIQSQVRS